jgi:DNA-binding transcriptional regulator/RsmH inhibitor MraZ
VSSSRSRLAERRRSFFDAVRVDPLVLQSVEGERLARFFASTWERSIQAQFQLNLPEALLKIWGSGSITVTVVGLGETLEIWESIAWTEHIAVVASEYTALQDRLLGQDGDGP